MRIYLREITEQETELSFTQEEKWVLDAVECVDEDKPAAPGLSPVARPAHTAPAKIRPVIARFSLRKVDEVVVLSGNVETHIRLLCSRCAAPFQQECDLQFSGLFCKDPDMAGVAYLENGSKPMGQNKGFARHAHDFSANGAEGDLDITYLSEDFIELGDVLTEQLRLQIPFQPLCQEGCKGICANCGADQNVGRCACAKLVSNSPFSVLRDLKIGT